MTISYSTTRPYGSAATYQFCARRSHSKIETISLEPPARLELATSSLPMRCYTTKPWWRSRGDLPMRYNRFGFISSVFRPFRLNMKGLSAKMRPRSHSLVVRATGNRVGLSLGSSNLPLGATSYKVLQRLDKSKCLTI